MLGIWFMNIAFKNHLNTISFEVMITNIAGKPTHDLKMNKLECICVFIYHSHEYMYLVQFKYNYSPT
jgi:hypothetical protein